MAKQIKQVVKKVIVRPYALVVLLVVIWTGYAAVTYLFRSVFRPTHVPAWFVDWQGHLEADALRAETMAGISGPAARAPLSHYHGVDRWFQPDSFNGCTVSGCHQPLPHGKSKELRAFANLHATFLACQTCHATPTATPMPTVWSSTSTGREQGPPAVLQLMNHLNRSTQPAEDVAAVNATTLKLLHETISVVGRDPVIDYLLVQLETSEPQSPIWRHTIAQLVAELPNHARGEYRAKITPAPGAATSQPSAEELAEWTKTYLSASPESMERANAKKQMHAGVVTEPKGCLACHGDKPPRLDFKALGYSDARAEVLAGMPIARLMYQIQQGQPFHLPHLLEGTHGR